MHKKIIIIGAPRSGTNMLRNTLVKLNGVETWPCDEINYIWRYANANVTSDEFDACMATKKTITYIQGAFNNIAEKTHANTIVEKTCANSLRVSFVNKVVPDAKYIFIVRDGVDAISSAALRWRAKLDFPYLMKKLRYVPVADIPHYGMEYLKSRIHMKSASDGRQSYWGPKLKELGGSLDDKSLMQICAMQWKACVESAATELDALETLKVFKIKYEDFVLDPRPHIEGLSHFMDLNVSEKQARAAVSSISSSNIGKGRQRLDGQSRTEIESIIKQTMISQGYKI